MAKKLFLVLLTITIYIGFIYGVFVFGNKNQSLSRPKDNQVLGVNPDNQDLVAEVEGFIENAKYHPGCLNELLNIAKKARYNHKVIRNAAYFVTNAGFHTLPVMQIAQLAYYANREVKYLNDLLEVSIIYDSESSTIVDLAGQAVYRQISDAELEQKISYYRNNSKWKTIAEVIENDEKE